MFKFEYFRHLVVLAALSVGLVVLVILTSQGDVSKASLKSVENSDWKDFDWTIYKHTVSINSGSYESTAEFVNKYITYIEPTVDLGCTSTKIIGALLTPSEDQIYGFTEIHWVDSAIFQTTGMTITNWTTYIEELRFEGFNAFMQNKVQLFVPDLQPHYDVITTNKLHTKLRLSSSSGASSLDTAHVLIYVPNSGHFYEMVGPSSSLSSDSLSNFVEWGPNECLVAQVLPKSLSTISKQYAIAKNYMSADEEAWSKSTGLSVPMGVGISIPTSSMDYIKSTIEIIESISSPKVSSFYNESSCSFYEIDFSTDDHYQPIVRYIDNDKAFQGTQYKVSDWETAITETHDKLIDETAEYSGWDRYLDSHIGVLPYYYNTELCDSTESKILDVLGESGLRYAPRNSNGIHFYVATDGLKTWEFNELFCSSNYTDICGCDAYNSESHYVATTGSVCSFE